MKDALAKKGRVLVVGDVNVDLVMHLPQQTAAGLAPMGEPTLTSGGSAGNTAYALRRLGTAVDFCGTVGNDAWGRAVRDEFAQAGIGVDSLAVDDALNTVCVFAFVAESGERVMWPWPKEKQSFRVLDEALLDWSVVDGAAWVHASGMVFSADTSARHTTAAILKRAHEKGIPTSFDLNLRAENDAFAPEAQKAVLDVLPWCSYVLGSADEEFPFLQGANTGEDGVEVAAQFANKERAVVARLGARGSVAITAAGRHVAPALPVEAVDPIGAGDAYNAGFIAALLAEKDLPTALLWGSATAAYAVAHPGPRNTPDMAALENMLAGV